jgi:EAL domain-containing protein (putative c-di-GMP-specific phosphodiesterase class I)
MRQHLRLVLDAVFSQSYRYEAGLERSLSVNLSVHDLYDPQLIDRIHGLFSTWGIRPELIQFKLTESALMEEPIVALETLIKLKNSVPVYSLITMAPAIRV